MEEFLARPVQEFVRGASATAVDAGSPKTEERKGKTATQLVISDPTDPGLLEFASLYTRFTLKSSQPIEPVGTWNQFGGALAGYSYVGQLVFCLHGAENTLAVGGTPKYLSEVRALLTKQGVALNVRELKFESCDVGAMPLQLADFATFFGKPLVSAYNLDYAHTLQEATARERAKTTRLNETELKNWLDKVDKYIKQYVLVGFDLTTVNARGIKDRIPLEWYTDQPAAQREWPKDWDDMKHPVSARGLYQSRASAQERLVTGGKELIELLEDQRTRPSRLRHVVIDLTKFDPQKLDITR